MEYKVQYPFLLFQNCGKNFSFKSVLIGQKKKKEILKYRQKEKFPETFFLFLFFYKPYIIFSATSSFGKFTENCVYKIAYLSTRL